LAKDLIDRFATATLTDLDCGLSGLGLPGLGLVGLGLSSMKTVRWRAAGLGLKPGRSFGFRN
jgi:hypothetical protein